MKKDLKLEQICILKKLSKDTESSTFKDICYDSLLNLCYECKGTTDYHCQFSKKKTVRHYSDYVNYNIGW